MVNLNRDGQRRWVGASIVEEFRSRRLWRTIHRSQSGWRRILIEHPHPVIGTSSGFKVFKKGQVIVEAHLNQADELALVEHGGHALYPQAIGVNLYARNGLPGDDGDGIRPAVGKRVVTISLWIVNTKKNIAAWFMKLEVDDVIVHLESREYWLQQNPQPRAIFGIEPLLDIRPVSKAMGEGGCIFLQERGYLIVIIVESKKILLALDLILLPGVTNVDPCGNDDNEQNNGKNEELQLDRHAQASVACLPFFHEQFLLLGPVRMQRTL